MMVVDYCGTDLDAAISAECSIPGPQLRRLRACKRQPVVALCLGRVCNAYSDRLGNSFRRREVAHTCRIAAFGEKSCGEGFSVEKLAESKWGLRGARLP